MIRRPRPYRREHRAIWFAILAVLLLIWRFNVDGESLASPERLDEGMHQVRRVVDGDTLVLTSGARVRLQGIDAPESVREGFPVEPWGPEASQFSKDFVARADRRVRLTFSLERIDRHDRFLAFVWNGDVMLNEEIVRAGLADARLGYRYSPTMKRRLAAARDEARRAGRGIWSKDVAPMTNDQ